MNRTDNMYATFVFSTLLATMTTVASSDLTAYVVFPRSRAYFCTYPDVCETQFTGDQHKRLFGRMSEELTNASRYTDLLASGGNRRLTSLDLPTPEPQRDTLTLGRYVHMIWEVNRTDEREAMLEFTLIPVRDSYDVITEPLTNRDLMLEYEQVRLLPYRPNKHHYHLLFNKSPASNFYNGTTHTMLALMRIVMADDPSVSKRAAYQVIDYKTGLVPGRCGITEYCERTMLTEPITRSRSSINTDQRPPPPTSMTTTTTMEPNASSGASLLLLDLWPLSVLFNLVSLILTLL